MHKKVFVFFALISFLLFTNLKAQNTSLELRLSELRPQNLIDLINIKTSQGLETFKTKWQEYKQKLQEQYQQKLNEVLSELNALRYPYYQYHTWRVANTYLGKNIYHDYRKEDGTSVNDDSNTCVNAWCQVMSETGVPAFYSLTSGQISYFNQTIEEEKKKAKPNLTQKKPAYINLDELLGDSESLGFLPIDVDLAQRGDFLVQYYRKKRIRNEFAAQHISIIDVVIPYGNGIFELRDWHEGIENEPFVYRTGYNMKSSFNNIFTAENIYYGFANDQGKERVLWGNNPNICQAYGYFGDNIGKAKDLIQQINYIRGQLYLIPKLKVENFLTKP